MADESSAKLDIELDDLELDITNSSDSAQENTKELSSGPSSVQSDDDNADVAIKPFNEEDIKHWDDEKIKEKLELAVLFDSYDEVVSILTKAFPDAEKRIEMLNTSRDTDTGNTLLHTAAADNKLKIVKYLLEEGADPNVKNEDEETPLHAVCDCFLSDEDISEVVKILIAKGSIIDARDESQRTPLHEAAKQGFTGAVQILLQHNADVEAKDSSGDQPIHEAAYSSNFGAIKVLVEDNPECVHWKGHRGMTPLHLVCSEVNQIQTVKFLMDKEADINAKDDRDETPLCCASEDQNNTEVVKLLLGAGADVNPGCKKTPLQRACNYGCSDTVSLLLKNGAKTDPKALEEAVTEGYEDIVKQLIRTPKWAVLLRHTFTDFWSDSNEDTTPFREMIRKMPDVAEEILNKCMVADPDYKNIDDSNYNVIFNYEFIEDIGGGTTRRFLFNDEDDGEDETDGNKKDVEKGYGVSYTEIRRERYRRRKNYTTTWGPKKFSKKQHPLAIMVESKRLNLLTHPVVGSLLHRKWLKFGQYGYFINLFTYCVFLIFLTTFALIIENPRSPNCINGDTNMMSANASETENGTTGTQNSACSGITGARRAFIYISAVIVILSALSRLIFEVIQLVSQFRSYFKDFTNWMEMTLFVCSIIFVWVFHTDCLCPLDWQWQVGVVAVFLAWIVLIFFISKLPFAGIYVLMFYKIFKTFLRMLSLTILLVLAFGLTFYLTFGQPEILRSPFSTPGRSLFKTMTMTTGEFDFDSIFRQDPTGESDGAEEIPFPPISFIFWIIFVIIMPILLTNMLVGLAVDDIKEVQNQAELKKLALQVDQVLTIEEFLPQRLRRRFISGCIEVFPNEKPSWREKLQFILWGGKKYNTRLSVEKVLHPHEDENEKIKRKTDKVLEEVENMKKENTEGREEIRQEIVELKAEMQKMMKYLMNKMESKEETEAAEQ